MNLDLITDPPACLRKGADLALAQPPTEFDQCRAVFQLFLIFRDPADALYLRVPRSLPGSRVIPLRSRQCLNFATEVFRHYLGRPPKEATLKRALRETEAEYTYGDLRERGAYPIHRRVQFHGHYRPDIGYDDRSITIDLADHDHTAVEITPTSAALIDGSDSHFTRPGDTIALAPPTPPKSPKKLLRKLRHLLKPATDLDFHRILVWLASTLHPHGPRPVLILDGPRHATSNAARFLRSVIDPVANWRNEFPTTDSKLRRLVDDNYILVFPALQRLSDKRAETLCRLAHDYRRSTILLLHRSRPDRPLISDPELQRSSLTVRLADDDPCPIAELKLRRHLDASISELLSLLVKATQTSLAQFATARSPKVPIFPDLARWTTAAATVLSLAQDQIRAALTPSNKKHPPQPPDSKPTSPASKLSSTVSDPALHPPALAPPTQTSQPLRLRVSARDPQ